MKNTTLCYIKNNGKYLLMHRIKKENDLNRDKWIGIGGKFEDKESPEQCNRREVFEETGLKLNSAEYKGIITFVSDIWETEYMHLFTSSDFSGTVKPDCDEGVLEWVDKLYKMRRKLRQKACKIRSQPYFRRRSLRNDGRVCKRIL